MHIMNLFYLTVVATYCFNTCSGVHTISKNIYLPLSEEITIESPGYPNENYESNTLYTWTVTAPELTEKINIRIELDVHRTPGYPCDDYLKIQEIKDSNFTLFRRCGKSTENIKARGNKLMITLYSNYDTLTAKGFLLRLKVSKMSTRSTITTTLATTPLLLSKTSKIPETKTTTKTKNPIPQRTKTGNKATKTESITEVKARKSRITKISTIFLNSKATKPTTLEVIMREVLSSAPTLYSSLPPLPSITEMDKTPKTTPVIITTDLQNTSPEKPESSRTKLNGESKETSQLWKGFLQSQEMDSQNASTISPEKPKSSNTENRNAETSTQSIPMSRGSIRIQEMSSQNTMSSEKPMSSSIKLSTETSTAESIPMSEGNQEIVILMVGVGVVEVTIIIVGILAVRRHRQQRKNTMKKSPKEANDRRPVSRKTVCSITNVYDTIPYDENDENPYKDLPEGVYDTTSKRRSHVNWDRSNSRGNIYFHFFHNSNLNGQ